VEGIILAYKRESLWCGTNVWLVRYRVKIRGKVEEREKYVTGVPQAHNDGKINMDAALAVAAVYNGKRIRILSTKFVGTGSMVNYER
jgi:hypothetical protein